MKINYECAVREIMDEYIFVPMGESALAFSGMITTTEVGAFIWKHLPEAKDENELVEKILAEYDTDRETAAADLAEFLQKLREMGIMD